MANTGAAEKWRREIPLAYPDGQKELYLKGDPSCIYEQWHKRHGIHKAGGNFPVMVARRFFKDLGYEVLDDYLLVRCPDKRKTNLGYRRLREIFGGEPVDRVVEQANHAGGDPDLFVYSQERDVRFFVEVKEDDGLTGNQLDLFPLIEEHLCDVFVVRVRSFSAWRGDPVSL